MTQQTQHKCPDCGELHNCHVHQDGHYVYCPETRSALNVFTGHRAKGLNETVTISWLEARLEAFADSYPNWCLDTPGARLRVAEHLFREMARVMVEV